MPKLLWDSSPETEFTGYRWQDCSLTLYGRRSLRSGVVVLMMATSPIPVFGCLFPLCLSDPHPLAIALIGLKVSCRASLMTVWRRPVPGLDDRNLGYRAGYGYTGHHTHTGLDRAGLNSGFCVITQLEKRMNIGVQRFCQLQG